jgi:hypothetical protein
VHIPKGVIEKLHKISFDFLWNGKEGRGGSNVLAGIPYQNQKVKEVGV